MRVPAHFCGVYTHKPTIGLVPIRGYGPPLSPPMPGHGDLAVVGPMAQDRRRSRAGVGRDRRSGRGTRGDRVSVGAASSTTRQSQELPRLRRRHPSAHADGQCCAQRDRSIVGTDRQSRCQGRAQQCTAAEPRGFGAAVYEAFGVRQEHEYCRLSFTRRCNARLRLWRPVITASQAERMRGTVMSHRDWLGADAARARLQQQWSLFFREWDVVLYPPASVPAFPHDHSLPIEARHLEIDGKGTRFTTLVSYGRTPPARAACRRPACRSIVLRPGCRSARKSSGLTLRIARRSPLLNFLNGSSAASCRRRAMLADTKFMHDANRSRP